MKAKLSSLLFVAAMSPIYGKSSIEFSGSQASTLNTAVHSRFSYSFDQGAQSIEPYLSISSLTFHNLKLERDRYISLRAETSSLGVNFILKGDSFNLFSGFGAIYAHKNTNLFKDSVRHWGMEVTFGSIFPLLRSSDTFDMVFSNRFTFGLPIADAISFSPNVMNGNAITLGVRMHFS